MRRIQRNFLIAALAGLFSCLAILRPMFAGETLSICVTNKSGEVFTNLSVGKVLGDGLLLENSAGQFKVKYADLPADLREKYQAGARAASQKEQADEEANARYVAGQRKYQAEEARLRAGRKPQDQKVLPAAPTATGKLKIEVPTQGWSIGIWNCGFGRLDTDSSSRQFVCRGMAGNGLNLSIFVESPEGTGMRPEDVYAFYWPKGSRNPLMDLKSVKMETLARFVKVSYTTAGMPNVNYYFAHKGKWVDVHISMFSNATTANKAFEEFQSQLSYGD